MQRIVHIITPLHNDLFDITRDVGAIITETGIRSGLVNVYAQGATGAIMIGFNMIGPLFANVRSGLKS